MSSPSDTSMNPYAFEKNIHPIQVRTLYVESIQQLSDTMVRIHVGGEQAEGFYSPGFDDHVKLFFPPQGHTQFALPQIGERGVVYDDSLPKPLTRDYTPRYYQPAKRQIALDFVLHEGGVAAEWAQNAQVGDALTLAGPRGSILIPTRFDWELLIGDETALPAIGRRLEELPATTTAWVFVALSSSQARQHLVSQASLQLQWLVSDASSPASEQLVAAIKAFELPGGEGMAWGGVEGSLVAPLRNLLLSKGLPLERQKISSYWKHAV